MGDAKLDADTVSAQQDEAKRKQRINELRAQQFLRDQKAEQQAKAEAHARAEAELQRSVYPFTPYLLLLLLLLLL